MSIRPAPFALAASSLVFLGCITSSSRPPAAPEAAPASERAPSGGTPSGAGAALAESAKLLVGAWRCSGSIYGADGVASPSVVIVDVKLDLDSAWLRSDFAVSSGKYAYQFDSYRSFDSAASQWVNVIVDNLGGHAISWSSDGVVWTGESRGPMGKLNIKDTETIVSPGEMRMLGQYSLDATTWRTGYDLSCNK